MRPTGAVSLAFARAEGFVSQVSNARCCILIHSDALHNKATVQLTHFD